MLNIQKYIFENGIDKTIVDFELKSKWYEDRIILKYDQLVSPTIMSLPEVQECRGLILERDTWKIISMGFKKFFNHGESNAHKIDWDTAYIFEKLDGSLINLYYYKDKWCVATTGTAFGEGEVNNKLGTTFNDLFWKTLNEKYSFDISLLDKNYVYLFELCTPYNIVVKPHGESSATLLTVRDLTTLKELSRENVIRISNKLKVPYVKSYDLNIKDFNTLIKTFDGMPFSEEGYVVCDANFNRVKIKNPLYLAVHHLKNRTAEHNILTIIKTNEIEEFISTFIDRKEEIYNLKEKYDNLIYKLESIWSELDKIKPSDKSSDERKRFAMSVIEIAAKNDLKMFTGLFFGLFDSKFKSVNEYIINYDDKALYKIL